jgi:hypothetical protein
VSTRLRLRLRRGMPGFASEPNCWEISPICRVADGSALPLPLAGEGWGGGVSASETVRGERVPPPGSHLRCDPTSPARGRGGLPMSISSGL